MTTVSTQRLEELLEAGGERPGLEFKEPSAWSVDLFAKDILAMTNTEEGGLIVVGIEDETLRRIGLDDAQLQSFNYDLMRDQMAPYAEPNVTFSVQGVRDRTGMQFVVITVEPFDELPAICTKGNGRAGIAAGVLYVRSRNRRPESTPVTRLQDLQRIIDRAAPIRLKRAADFVRAASSSKAERDAYLDSELGGL